MTSCIIMVRQPMLSLVSRLALHLFAGVVACKGAFQLREEMGQSLDLPVRDCGCSILLDGDLSYSSSFLWLLFLFFSAHSVLYLLESLQIIVWYIIDPRNLSRLKVHLYP